LFEGKSFQRTITNEADSIDSVVLIVEKGLDFCSNFRVLSNSSNIPEARSVYDDKRRISWSSFDMVSFDIVCERNSSLVGGLLFNDEAISDRVGELNTQAVVEESVQHGRLACTGLTHETNVLGTFHFIVVQSVFVVVLSNLTDLVLL
jgi:hypothetical protein